MSTPMELERPGGEILATRPEVVPEPRIDVVATPRADLVARAGTALRTAAERLRSSGAVEGERMRSLATVPGGLDRVGRYLQERQVDGLRSDAEHLIIGRPVLVLLAAVTLGYAAGRAIRR